MPGCLLYIWLVPGEIRDEIGGSFTYLNRHLHGWGPTGGTLGLAAVAGMSGYLAMSRRLGNKDRRQRWLLRGTRPLILCGAVAVAVIILLQLYPTAISDLGLAVTERDRLSTNQVQFLGKINLTSNELHQVIQARGTNWIDTVEKVGPVIAAHPPAWPVILAGAAFLYLLWLAVLLFDLTFVWHRYIRRSTTNDRLREWNPYGFPRRWAPGSEEPCCNPERVGPAGIAPAE